MAEAAGLEGAAYCFLQPIVLLRLRLLLPARISRRVTLSVLPGLFLRPQASTLLVVPMVTTGGVFGVASQTTYAARIIEYDVPGAQQVADWQGEIGAGRRLFSAYGRGGLGTDCMVDLSRYIYPALHERHMLLAVFELHELGTLLASGWVMFVVIWLAVGPPRRK